MAMHTALLTADPELAGDSGDVHSECVKLNSKREGP